MRCILCESREIQKLERIKKESLVLLYKKMLGIDINYLISQDIDFFYKDLSNIRCKYYVLYITVE